MKNLYIIFLLLLFSCSNNSYSKKKITEIDINSNLSFNQYKEIIEKNSFIKGYPDINE